jgi:hypothetical protein
MNLAIDPDVQAVLEFMQREIPAVRLISVAEAVSAMGPILWGHYDRDTVRPLSLVTEKTF